MKKILNIIGIVLLMALGSVAYYVGTKKSKQAPEIVYERTFHTGYTVSRYGQSNVVLGACNTLQSHFKVNHDSAFLTFQGKPQLLYKILGVDADQGLHLIGIDSVHVIVFKRFDPRLPANEDSSGLQFIFIHRNAKGEILLFPTKKCL